MGTLKRLARTTLSLLAWHRPQGFWLGSVIGILYFSWIFRWIWSLYPLTEFGIRSSAISFILVSMGFWGSVFVMAVTWGVASWLIMRGWQKYSSYLFAPYAAAVFVLAEYTRSWLYGILWWGSGSVLGPHWTFGNIAYWFSDIAPLRLSSAIWGIYGIEFLLVSWIAFGWVSYRKQLWKHYLITSLVISGGFGVSHLLLKNLTEPDEGLPVSIIQTQRPTLSQANTAAVLQDTTEKLRLMGSLRTTLIPGSIVVFPEGGGFTSLLSSYLAPSDMEGYYARLSDSPTLIFDNNQADGDTGATSQVTVVNSKEGLVDDRYDKRLLTPWGEYLPFLIELPVRLLKPSLLTTYQSSRQFRAGAGDNTISTTQGTYGVLVCSDVISPSLSRDQEQHVIVTMTSNAIFRGNLGLQDQILAMTRFRASERHKAVILASNFGRSHIINSYGNTAVSADNPGYRILTGFVVPNGSVTWYTKAGDMPIILLSLAFLWYIWKTDLLAVIKSRFSSFSWPSLRSFR